MRDNFFGNDKETCDNRNAVPWEDPKNTIDEKCEQLGSFKEKRNNKDTCAQNLKELKFLEHLIKKECLKNLTLNCHIDVKQGRGKH